MSIKFSVAPMTVVLGNITVTLGYDPQNPQNCIIEALASGSQTIRSAYVQRNGNQIVQADGAASATDQQNCGLALRDAALQLL